jgi:hypothetical protein
VKDFRMLRGTTKTHSRDPHTPRITLQQPRAIRCRVMASRNDCKRCAKLTKVNEVASTVQIDVLSHLGSFCSIRAPGCTSGVNRPPQCVYIGRLGQVGGKTY